jgi:hypothetical protein
MHDLAVYLAKELRRIAAHSALEIGLFALMLGDSRIPPCKPLSQAKKG